MIAAGGSRFNVPHNRVTIRIQHAFGRYPSAARDRRAGSGEDVTCGSPQAY